MRSVWRFPAMVASIVTSLLIVLACLAELIAQAEINPASFARLDFIVLAPEAAIAKGKFRQQMERDSIRSKVKRRVSAYDGALDKWYHDYFEPTLERVRLISLSWEAVIYWIGKERVGEAKAFTNFYERCLAFN